MTMQMNGPESDTFSDSPPELELDDERDEAVPAPAEPNTNLHQGHPPTLQLMVNGNQGMTPIRVQTDTQISVIRAMAIGETRDQADQYDLTYNGVTLRDHNNGTPLTVADYGFQQHDVITEM